MDYSTVTAVCTAKLAKENAQKIAEVANTMVAQADVDALRKAAFESYTQLSRRIDEGGGSGGTTDYNELTNKPKLAGKELKGNVTLAQLSIATTGALDAEEKARIEKDNQFETALGGKVNTEDIATMADTSKANAFTKTNDFSAITVHTAEYTPTQVQQLTGIDQYNFKRRLQVGEVVDTGLPTAAIQNISMTVEGIISADTSGTTVVLTGVAEGSTVLGLQTITGYLMQMNFYCIPVSSEARSYAKVQIDGIKNGDVLKAGQTYTISSVMYADTAEGRAALPTGDVADIYANNSSSGIDGCSIAYKSADWGGQTYTIDGHTYTGMSRCYFTLSNLKPGIYTLGGFYVGMDRSETNPVEAVNSGLNTTTLTFAVTNSGQATEYDLIDVEDKFVELDALVQKFKADYYTTHKFVMTGAGTYGSSTNIIMANGRGDKTTAFNLENDFDISRLTVSDETYATWDFTNKKMTYIQSTTDNTPHEVQLMLDGTVIGSLWINFTSTRTVQPTNINYEVNEPRL